MMLLNLKHFCLKYWENKDYYKNNFHWFCFLFCEVVKIADNLI